MPVFAQRPNKGQELSGRGSKGELGKEHLVPSYQLSKSRSLDGREEEPVLRHALVQLVLKPNCRLQETVSDVHAGGRQLLPLGACSAFSQHWSV